MCLSPLGGRSASDLHVDHGGAAGVQPQRKPQCPDVIRLPALPHSGQPGPQLELPAPQLYPFCDTWKCQNDKFDYFMIKKYGTRESGM